MLHFNFPFNSAGLLEGKMNKPEIGPSWPCQDGEAEAGAAPRDWGSHLAGAQALFTAGDRPWSWMTALGDTGSGRWEGPGISHLPPGKATPTVGGSRTRETLYSESWLPNYAQASGPVLPAPCHHGRCHPGSPSHWDRQSALVLAPALQVRVLWPWMPHALPWPLGAGR